MAKFISESKGKRTITLEFSENDLATLVASLGTSSIENMRQFLVANNIDPEKMHNFSNSRDLFTSLYKVLKSE